MRLSIVMSTHAAAFNAVAYKGDFETNVSKVASYGYDGVEPAVRDPKLVDHDGLIAAVSRHGMAIPAIGTGQAWGEEGLSFTDPDPHVRQRAIDRIAAHVPLAKKAGAVIIIGLVRGGIPDGVSKAHADSWMHAGLDACAGMAAAAGVRIGLEPLNRYETPLLNTARECLDLIDRLGRDNLGLVLDTFHMNIEEPGIEESIRTCGKRIFHFHVADSNRWQPGCRAPGIPRHPRGTGFCGLYWIRLGRVHGDA